MEVHTMFIWLRQSDFVYINSLYSIVGSHQFCADAAPFFYDFVLEFLILKSIRFEKSEQSVIGDVGQSFGDALRVEFLENLAYLFGGMSTEEERIVRHIEEVFFLW